jgi:hypothetical protein
MKNRAARYQAHQGPTHKPGHSVQPASSESIEFLKLRWKRNSLVAKNQLDRCILRGLGEAAVDQPHHECGERCEFRSGERRLRRHFLCNPPRPCLCAKRNIAEGAAQPFSLTWSSGAKAGRSGTCASSARILTTCDLLLTRSVKTVAENKS